MPLQRSDAVSGQQQKGQKSLNYIKLFALMLVVGITKGLYAQELGAFLRDAQQHSAVLKAQSYKSRSKHSAAKGESMFKSNPILSLAHSNSPINNWPSLNQHAMSGIEISLVQTIAFPWEDVYRKREKFKLFMSQKQIENEVRDALFLKIKKNYHQLYFLYKKEQLLIESKQSLNDIVTQARALVGVDKMSSSQLLKLEADLTILENQILEVRAAERKKEAMLEATVGKSYKWQKIKNVVTWQKQSPSLSLPSGFDVKQHPLYRAMHFNVQASAAGLAKEKGKLFPQVSIGASYRFRQEVSGKDGEDFISLKASTPLPLYYPLKERHTIAAKDATLSAAKSEFEDVKIKLTKYWEGETGRARQLLDVYAKYEKEVLPRYLASYQAQRGALSAGTVSLLDVLDSYRRYLMVQIETARIHRDLQESIAFLEYLKSTAGRGAK